MRLLGKVLLAIVTLFALLDSIAAGAFVAPALLPFQWKAARTARNGWTRGAWIFGAALCAWLGGLLVGYNFVGQNGYGTFAIPLAVTGVTTITFIATTDRSPSEELV